jgi:hypothetical protein
VSREEPTSSEGVKTLRTVSRSVARLGTPGLHRLRRAVTLVKAARVCSPKAVHRHAATWSARTE